MAFPVRFWASRVRAWLSRCIFGLFASAHCFPGAFSGFSRPRMAFHGVFSSLSRLRMAFPVCFWGSRVRAWLSTVHFRAFRVCAWLSRCAFGVLASAHGFPGVFSGFSRLRMAFPVCFWASRVCAWLSTVCFQAFRVCAWLSRCVFGLFAPAHGFPGVFLGFSRLRMAALTLPQLSRAEEAAFFCSGQATWQSLRHGYRYAHGRKSWSGRNATGMGLCSSCVLVGKSKPTGFSNLKKNLQAALECSQGIQNLFC